MDGERGKAKDEMIQIDEDKIRDHLARWFVAR
jgi:hypothetical protein